MCACIFHQSRNYCIILNCLHCGKRKSNYLKLTNIFHVPNCISEIKQWDFTSWGRKRCMTSVFLDSINYLSDFIMCICKKCTLISNTLKQSMNLVAINKLKGDVIKIVWILKTISGHPSSQVISKLKTRILHGNNFFSNSRSRLIQKVWKYGDNLK